mgnify:CR=1 FL=1
MQNNINEQYKDEASGMVVYVLGSPLDFFESYTISIEDYLRNEFSNFMDKDQIGFSNFSEIVKRYETAIDLFNKYNRSGELRDKPRVAYNWRDDNSYFIFKCENGGDTIIIGTNL